MKIFTLSSALLLISLSGIAQWSFVGPAGISNDWTVGNDIETDASGSPVIIFSENSEDKASCLRYNGMQWEQVGEATFYQFSITEIIDFVIDNNNNYYILYLDVDYNTSCIRFDGETWEFVGSPYISSEYSPFRSLAVDTAGIAYVASQSQSGFSIAKEDGDSWIPVSIEGLSGVDRYFDLVFDKDNVAFFGYCSTNGKAPNCAKLVNDNWESIGTPISSPLWFVGETHLLITENHQIYMGFFYPEMGFYKFDAESDNWLEVETASMGSEGMGISDMATDSNSNIYISILSDKARCYTYEDSSWKQLGNSGISDSEAAGPRIAINKHDQIYATYNDFTLGQAVVKTYGKSSDIDDLLQNESFHIYPNPTSGFAEIQFPNEKNETFEVTLFDTNGKRILTKITTHSSAIKVDLSNYNSGIYVFRLFNKSSNRMSFGKILKQ